MKDFDFTDLDGKVLRCFLIILEENSVSKAADRMGVTQSAVSHTLAKLRRVLADPLFVRSGQGLTPTERALALKDPVQRVLDAMKSLTEERPFTPQSEVMSFAVATNDMPRDLLFPALLHTSRTAGIDLRLQFMPAGVPDADLLRSDRCQVMLTPLPPDGPDIYQKRLLSSPMRVYFDASMRDAPDSREAYCAADHADVQFPDGRSAQSVLRGLDRLDLPGPVVTLPHFNALPPFIRGSTLISTDSALMKHGPLADLDCAPLPFDCEPIAIYLVWHQRSNSDPAHRWLRQQIEAAAQGLAVASSV